MCGACIECTQGRPFDQKDEKMADLYWTFKWLWNTHVQKRIAPSMLFVEVRKVHMELSIKAE